VKTFVSLNDAYSRKRNCFRINIILFFGILIDDLKRFIHKDLDRIESNEQRVKNEEKGMKKY